MQIDIQSAGPVETLVVPLAQERLDERLGALGAQLGVDAAALQRGFKAEPRETLALFPLPAGAPAQRVVLLGLGKAPGARALQQSLRSFVHRHRARGLVEVGVELSPFEHDLGAFVQSAVEGVIQGLYAIDRFKSERAAAPGLERLVLLAPEARHDEARVFRARGEAVAAAQVMVFDLVNAPGNHLTPEALAQAAVASGAAHGYRVTVLDRQQIADAGLGALLAVNQGSALPPAFVVLEYTPDEAPEPCPTIGLVGKGVTFDTGGISLKDSANLWYMKCDMAGGAAVLGAVEAAARLKVPVRVVAAIPATDNKPGGAALNPGDVITTFAGLTVEVEDTDAEGRLILADGLAYLRRHFTPDVMIDVATLTGACVIALGQHAAGLFTPDDALAAALEAAGRRSGERVWRLPLWDDYDAQIRSDVADVKNLGGRPAGAITAAAFLKKFVGGHTAWAHLDIAGTAFTDSEFASYKSSTAFGVKLLVEYLLNTDFGSRAAD